MSDVVKSVEEAKAVHEALRKSRLRYEQINRRNEIEREREREAQRAAKAKRKEEGS